MDINCDMGESFGAWSMGADDSVMPHITSANVACGAHAGDPRVMRRTVRLARAHGVDDTVPESVSGFVGVVDYFRVCELQRIPIEGADRLVVTPG